MMMMMRRFPSLSLQRCRPLCTSLFRQLGLDVPDDADHFKLLSLPDSYEVDLDALDAAFKRLQRQLHPDKFSARPATDQALATEASGRVNEAFTTLKDPFRRAAYLLRVRHSVDVEEEGTNATDQALLMEAQIIQFQLALRKAVVSSIIFDAAVEFVFQR